MLLFPPARTRGKFETDFTIRLENKKGRKFPTGTLRFEIRDEVGLPSGQQFPRLRDWKCVAEHAAADSEVAALGAIQPIFAAEGSVHEIDIGTAGISCTPFRTSTNDRMFREIDHALCLSRPGLTGIFEVKHDTIFVIQP